MLTPALSPSALGSAAAAARTAGSVRFTTAGTIRASHGTITTTIEGAYASRSRSGSTDVTIANVELRVLFTPILIYLQYPEQMRARVSQGKAWLSAPLRACSRPRASPSWVRTLRSSSTPSPGCGTRRSTGGSASTVARLGRRRVRAIGPGGWDARTGVGTPNVGYLQDTDPLTRDRYNYVNGDPVNLTDPVATTPTPPGGRLPRAHESWVYINPGLQGDS